MPIVNRVKVYCIALLILGQGPPKMSEFGPGGMPPLPAGPPMPLFPDMSRPPPGFASGPGGFGPPGPQTHPPSLMSLTVRPPAAVEADLTPSMPYFELPAGLMAPLVKVGDRIHL